MKTNYKFAHLADCHVGAWREPKLRSLTFLAFEKAIEKIIQEKVEFVLIAGDLFHTPIPGIEALVKVTEQLNRLKEHGIRVYAIPGSHDFSASGKTMLKVLEKAGLLTLVSEIDSISEDGKIRLKIFQDKDTGAWLTGVLGRRAGLEKEIFEDLDRNYIENKINSLEGLKIFLLHTALDVHAMQGMSFDLITPLSNLPKGFDYYAAGHIHKKSIKDLKETLGGILSYPGPLMPDSFSELEEFGSGGFYIIEVENNKISNVVWQEISLKEVLNLTIDVSGLNSLEAKAKLIKLVEEVNVTDKIVLFRIQGALSQGRTQDLNINDFVHQLYSKGAYFVLKNISKLTTKEFEVVKKNFSDKSTLEEIEDDFIRSHLGTKEVYFKDREFDIIKGLMKILGQEKKEGETKHIYEERILNEVKKYLNF